MRRLEVAALALLVAAAAAAATVLLITLFRDRRRWRPGSSSKPPEPELPLSMPTTKTTIEGRRRHVALLILLFSGRRRARVEPAAAPLGNRAPSPATAPAADGHAPSSSTAAVMEEDAEVAAWRERWFGGPVSRALYTIYEEEDEEDAGAGGDMDGDRHEAEKETETPFYTPPASPPRASDVVDGGNNGAVVYVVPIQLTH